MPARREQFGSSVFLRDTWTRGDHRATNPPVTGQSAPPPPELSRPPYHHITSDGWTIYTCTSESLLTERRSPPGKGVGTWLPAGTEGNTVVRGALPGLQVI